MGSSYICVFMLIIAFMAIRASTKKNDTKRKQAQSRAEAEQKRVASEKRSEAMQNQMLKSARANATAKGGADIISEPTEIEKRRMQQQEAANRSRIHQNIRSAANNEKEDTIPTEMLQIRDLIVCGYPINIPGERDFVKEGEDFLASFSSKSVFL